MGNAFSFAGEDTLIIWLQAHMGAAGSALESFFAMFGEELLLIPVLGFFCWCYDKKLGKLLGRNICAEIVCSPMIKTSRCATPLSSLLTSRSIRCCSTGSEGRADRRRDALSLECRDMITQSLPADRVSKAAQDTASWYLALVTAYVL